MTYFLTFRARGEVAEILLLGGETPRLLVDLSTEPLFDDKGPRRHTPRASFTICDPDLIRRFLADVSIGDVAEAEGVFVQGNYHPHRTSHIDTVFTVHAFRRLTRGTQKRPDAARGLADTVTQATPPAAALLH